MPPRGLNAQWQFRKVDAKHATLTKAMCAPHLEWSLAYPKMNEKCGNLSFEMGEQVVLTEDGWRSYKYVVSGQNDTFGQCWFLRHKAKQEQSFVIKEIKLPAFTLEVVAANETEVDKKNGTEKLKDVTMVMVNVYSMAGNTLFSKLMAQDTSIEEVRKQILATRDLKHTWTAIELEHATLVSVFAEEIPERLPLRLVEKAQRCHEDAQTEETSSAKRCRQF